jgi:hypothetical protein
VMMTSTIVTGFIVLFALVANRYLRVRDPVSPIENR